MENVWVLFDSESRERLGNFKSASAELMIYFMTSGYEVYPYKHAKRKGLWELRIMYGAGVDGYGND